MPQQCSDLLGEGYTGVWPACTYSHDPEEIDLSRLPEHPSGEDWSMYFDAYDPTKQEMAERDAVTDISQLQDIWSLQSGQLGEAWELGKGQIGENWGLKRGELGWGAGLGLKEARRTGIGAKRKSGMAFSGTAEEMQRLAESNVMGNYERGLKAGKTAYEQALESGQMGYEQALATGELGLTQGITDIYQQLGQDIYGYVEDWEDYQRDTRNMLYSSGLDWSKEEEQPTLTCDQQGMQTCPDGTCAPWDSTCAGQGQDPDACPTLGQIRCPDGTCVYGDDPNPCENHGGSGSNCEPGSCTEEGCGVTCDPFVETWDSSSCTCEL